MRIYIVRHGETEWNKEGRVQGHLDSPLTETGKRDAGKLAEKFDKIEFAKVFSSPTRRAVDTCEIITSGRYDIHLDSRLREIQFGIWEGKLFNELDTEYSELRYNLKNSPDLFDGKPINAENLYEVQKRGVEFIEELINSHQDGNILIVSHTMTIRGIILHFMDKHMKEFWSGYHLYPTGVSIIEVIDGKAEVIDTGNREHVGDA